MKISKNETHLIVEIPLTQEWYDAANEPMGNVPNINALIAGDEMGFAQLIALGYKQDIQQGEIIVKWYGDKDEFKKLCASLSIDCHEYPVCAYCDRPIYGAFTVGDKGNMCFNCNKR